MDAVELIGLAKTAMKRAYAPYSDYHVGAALLAKNGKVYLGCNIENAAFTPGICAERTAFAKAVSEGDVAFQAIAVVGGKGGRLTDYAAPCGVCRQVMSEFCDDEFLIILGKDSGGYVEHRLVDFLPRRFGPKDLS